MDMYNGQQFQIYCVVVKDTCRVEKEGECFWEERFEAIKGSYYVGQNVKLECSLKNKLSEGVDQSVMRWRVTSEVNL